MYRIVKNVKGELKLRPQSTRLISARAATFTARQMDTIIARYYSLGLVLTGFEMYTHAQAQAKYLNPLVYAITLGFTLASIAGMLLYSWLRDYSNVWYLLHAASVALNVFLWPVAMADSSHLPNDFTPYVFWSLGWGAISAGLGLRRAFAVVYIVLVPVIFAFIQTSPMGGSASWFRAGQDLIYTVLIGAVITAMVHMLRHRAQQQDAASEQANLAAAGEAAANAVAHERLRLGALVHNQVLSALTAAINAYSPEDKAAAKALASSAIARLSSYESEIIDAETQVPVAAFFESLTNLVRQQAPEFTVSSELEGSLEIPIDVTTALSEAMMQAIVNSQLHAGRSTTKRRVKLRAAGSSVKIAVADDGRGFRPSRVPKNRLGIRTMIFKRVKQIGGTAHINSAPGDGTQVVLEWSAQ
jgi:signal transduction histidine kinase